MTWQQVISKRLGNKVSAKDLEVLGDKIRKIKKNTPESHQQRYQELLAELVDANHTVQELRSPLKTIMRAISDGTTIEKIDLSSQTLDPNFRFISRSDPEGSHLLSLIISKTVIASRQTVLKEASRQGLEVRNANADKFAKKMFNIIKDMKEEGQAKTVRATVELLNQRNIDSFNGKKWHIGTLQSLQKRWSELGLS